MIFKNDNFQGDIFGLKNEYKYCMEIECLYLYCRSQEVASSVAQPFAAFLSFLPFSFFPLFFLLLPPSVFQQHSFHPQYREMRSTFNHQQIERILSNVYFSPISYVFISIPRVPFILLYERRIYTRMTHACSRPSFLFLFCFFLFPTRFFQTRTISSFFFYGSIHSTTVNFFFFFFASLYLPGYFVTCSSLYSSIVSSSFYFSFLLDFTSLHRN